MHIRTNSVVWISFLMASALLALSACSGRGDGGGGTGPAPASSFAIGGTTSGLSGTVVLQNNGGDNLTISVNGGFTFAAALTNSSPYAVTVIAQPAGQICTVANGIGTVAGANITNVTVTCAANTFSVGGTISGLIGTGLVLQDNGGDNLAVSANGTFTFSTAIASGAAYSVTVLTQPTNPSQSCTVTNGSGTVASTNVTNVAVSCATNTFTVGGTISGLSGTVVLRNNGGNDLTVSANGTFTFST